MQSSRLKEIICSPETYDCISELKTCLTYPDNVDNNYAYKCALLPVLFPMLCMCFLASVANPIEKWQHFEFWRYG
jgi:hypothetical protein